MHSLKRVHKNKTNLKKTINSTLEQCLKDFSLPILIKSSFKNYNNKQVSLVPILTLLQPKRLILQESIEDIRAILSN